MSVSTLAEGMQNKLPPLGGNDYIVVGVIAVVALAALAIGFVLRREVLAAGEGTPKMQEIGRAVQEGATAYLNRQFRTLAVFVVIVFVLLFALPGPLDERIGRSIFFLVGALFSATIGSLGMRLATFANIRVASAAREDGGREKATRIAFRTGGAVGMFTVGLGLLGASVVVLVYAGQAPKVLEGFGFGAALLAMFMRVGGGIFTKAADVGADLVGKVEQGIPEDDPRNAATIAHPRHRRVRPAGAPVPADRAGHRRRHRGDRGLHHPHQGG
jgi:K(+)-stimulated pyrophosphate-energized sodium pump